MTNRSAPAPWPILIPVGLGTGLSLIGDSSLYAVLPTHTLEAGISLAGVGLLLSANRFIRLVLNGPAGLAFDRWPRRPLFVLSLFAGAVSTAIYALTLGFWPLLAGRLLWGLAWAGIWIGGNTIILDAARIDNRGRWVGFYQISFFLGAASGALIGGVLTDWLGYHPAMGICAGLNLAGAVVALIFLPETRGQRQRRSARPQADPEPAAAFGPHRRAELISATALLWVNRLALAGMLSPTFGLFLLERLGDPVELGGRTFGVATLTGIGLGLNALISMTAAPLIGGWSDRLGNRWQAAAGGVLPGVAGFGMLAFGAPLVAVAGLPLTAVAGGSSQGLSTTLIGDLSAEGRHSRQLGWLFTMGDLASAIGPPLAYNLLIPVLGLAGVYALSGGLFGLMFLVSAGWAAAVRRRHAAVVS